MSDNAKNDSRLGILKNIKLHYIWFTLMHTLEFLYNAQCSITPQLVCLQCIRSENVDVIRKLCKQNCRKSVGHIW